jgi:hypothetical protein
VRPVAGDHESEGCSFHAYGGSCSAAYGRVHVVGIAGPAEKPHVHRWRLIDAARAVSATTLRPGGETRSGFSLAWELRTSKPHVRPYHAMGKARQGKESGGRQRGLSASESEIQLRLSDSWFWAIRRSAMHRRLGSSAYARAAARGH